VRIDVYAKAFPHDRGYTILESNTAQALIIRREDISTRLPEALGEFLGARRFEVHSENVTHSKPYGDEYRKFTSTFRLPVTYLDEQLRSTYSRHFYSEAERRDIREQWAPGTSGASSSERRSRHAA
jgi:putative capsular polysaccharide synthesis protein